MAGLWYCSTPALWLNLTKRSHHGQGLFYLSEKHSLTRWIPVLIDLYTSDAVGYFEKNNELSELVNLDWTWPLLLPVIEFFSQLFAGLWYSAPLAFLRGENALNMPSYVDGRDDCKHIISFASWAPLQHHNGHSSPKDMDYTQQAIWGANVYTPHLLSATMEDPEMPTHLGTQSSLSCSLSLSLSFSLHCLYLTILWRLSHLLLFSTFLVAASCKQGRYARNNSGVLCT